MANKIFIIVGFLVFVSSGQGIQISGTVQDSATGKPIFGAKVVLSTAKLSDTTDSIGSFHFNGTVSALVKSAKVFRHNPVITSEHKVLFTIEAEKMASLTVQSLNGKAIYHLQKKLGPGSHAFTLPVTGQGVYLCRLNIGAEGYNLKLVNLDKNIAGRLAFVKALNPSSAGKLASAAAAAVDTLRAYRKDYQRATIILSNYVAANQILKLKMNAGYDTNQILPDPDTKPVATGKPLKVFILMGQSNMNGYGQIAPDTTKGTLAYLIKNKNNFAPHTINNTGAWTIRNDVWDVNFIAGGGKKDWHTVGFGNDVGKIGPEFQFGHIMGYVHEEPVLIIKTCNGNRSLGWDCLPPGSVRYDYEGRTYAGYGDSAQSWPVGASQRVIDSLKVGWYAGLEIDLWMKEAHMVLNDIPKYYPGYNAADGYEVAGFGWFQGHKDSYMPHAIRYEVNLCNLVRYLRKEFNAPNAKFSCVTIAFGGYLMKDPGWIIVQKAQLNVSGDNGNYPEFYGNVKTREGRGYWRDASISPTNKDYHYNFNAETYYLVGNAMGWAMADLLKK